VTPQGYNTDGTGRHIMARILGEAGRFVSQHEDRAKLLKLEKQYSEAKKSDAAKN